MSRPQLLIAVAWGLYVFVTTLTSPPSPYSTFDPVTRAVMNGFGAAFAIWLWSPWLRWAGRQVQDFWETIRA